MFNEFRFPLTEREVVGEHPTAEIYETYTGKSKMMELSFFPTNNQFELYIEKISDDLTPNETTDLFAEMVKRIQNKANEINQPVTLMLDPVNTKIGKWASSKAVTVIGSWDEVRLDDNFRGILKKVFHPQNVIK